MQILMTEAAHGRVGERLAKLVPGAQVVMIEGSNPAETMPPIMQYFETQRRAGGKLIVADPRRTETARAAHLHLQLTPGTDAALVASSEISSRSVSSCALPTTVSAPNRASVVSALPNRPLPSSPARVAGPPLSGPTPHASAISRRWWKLV